MVKRSRVNVDLDLCQGHSVCMDEVPQVFQVEEQASGCPKTRILMEYPPEEVYQQAEAAALWCPKGVNSIEWVDEDTIDTARKDD